MRLRYSDIVGKAFYGIRLSTIAKDLVDTHFTGAAHHLRRFEEAEESKHKGFHIMRHRMHLQLMMKQVYEYGDFTMALDPSNRDLDHQGSWNPDWTTMPDQNMFNKMFPDWRYLVGKAHCADQYLHADDFLKAIDSKNRLYSKA